MKSKYLLLSLMVGVLLISCKGKTDSFQLTLDGENGEINHNTLVYDTTGNRFSAIDKNQIYGFGWKSIIDSKYANKDLKIVFTCKQKCDMDFKSKMTFQIDDLESNKTVIWKQFDSYKYLTTLNEWVEVKDSVIIKKEEIKANKLKFAVFPLKDEGEGKFYVDDLKVTVETL